MSVHNLNALSRIVGRRADVTSLSKLSRSSRRWQSSSNPSANKRVERLNSRLPRFLRSFTDPLFHAPVTHITSFLILHEITAIVPLFGLATVFHYYNWQPSFLSEWKWLSEGIEKFSRYFRRKGWLGDGQSSAGRWWNRGEGGIRLVVNFASAYALTKALLPARLLFSVWATPWFARTVIVPVSTVFRRFFRRSKRNPSPSSNRTLAAGTGATGGGVIGQANSRKA